MIKNPTSINTISAKKILITGGAGFLGSHLTEKLYLPAMKSWWWTTSSRAVNKTLHTYWATPVSRLCATM